MTGHRRAGCRPRGRALAAAGLALALASLAAGATAAERPSDARGPLLAAVREVPPFAMRDAAGRWRGLSVELWQAVVGKLELDFDWAELSLEETLAALEAGEVDAAIAALTITAERERRIDFSHAYYVSGLSLAYRPGSGGAWLATLRGLLSAQFLGAVGTLALVLLAAGLAVWLFERRRNAEQFGHGSTVRGLGDGFWWSAVTMTTVGYGDKAPTTLGGRIVALVWMFASLFIIAGLTATIAASLTAGRLEATTLLRRDLSDLRVGVLEESAAEGYATDRGAAVRRFPSVEAALDALERGGVQVVLHDAPVLRHHVRKDFDVLAVASEVLVRDDYGLGLPSGSPLREDVNAALLSVLREPVWKRIRARYLGGEAAE